MPKNILNYKYEIFPTAPQKTQLNAVLRMERLQWNKAVTIRKKLKAALISKQFDYIIHTLLSNGKSNTQSTRAAAIMKLQAEFQGLDFASCAKLYDIKNIVGNTLGDVTVDFLDNNNIISKIKEKFEAEASARKAAKESGIKLPSAKVYWQLLRAINQYAGYAAKTYMDNSFKSPGHMSLSTVRFAVSGSAKSMKWLTATQPAKGQREYGATGEPRYKKRVDSFGPWTMPGSVSSLTRLTRENEQIYIAPIKSWVNIAYHRRIPAGSDILTMSVMSKAGRYFAVLSVEVPAEAYAIKSVNQDWAVGINPAETTALTCSLKNMASGDRAYVAFHYEFLEKSLDRLEKLQQALALKHGPKRKLNGEEITERVLAFKKKLSNKLTEKEKNAATLKEKERLSKIMIPTETGPSKKWKKLAMRVAALNFHVANQRLDVRHKIARFLAETADVIGIGDWEPEREIPYRKKLKELKEDIKKGIEGAEKALKELQASKSKNGERNSGKKRREAADRAIATLRMAVKEKAARANVYANVSVEEPGTTYTCNHCHAETGPRGKEGLKVREWVCPVCGTHHNRNINAGFNILDRTLENIEATGEAHAPVPETGELPNKETAARMPAQGATVQSTPIYRFGFRATEQDRKGGIFISPSLKSLIDMNVVREPQRYVAGMRGAGMSKKQETRLAIPKNP